jgi:hypothetical protein
MIWRSWMCKIELEWTLGGEVRVGNERSEVLKRARRLRSTGVVKWDSGLVLHKALGALVPPFSATAFT